MAQDTSAALAAKSVSASYDAACKRLLSEKQILSRIMHEWLDEFSPLTPQEIEHTCFEGEPVVGKEPVERDYRAAARTGTFGAEDSTISEGVVTFDIRFTARIPSSGEFVQIELDVEAQNDSSPGYPLTKRAVYYGGRMLSMQGERQVTRSHYERVHKVVSIWICTHPKAEHRGSVTRFRLYPDDLVGHGSYRQADYDLLEVLMVCLDDKDPLAPGGILALLGMLLISDIGSAEKVRSMEADYGMIVSEDVKEEVSTMCNLSEGVLERGRAEGRAEGRAAAGIEHVLNVMRNLSCDAETAMDLMSLPADERAAVRKALVG